MTILQKVLPTTFYDLRSPMRSLDSQNLDMLKMSRLVFKKKYEIIKETPKLFEEIKQYRKYINL